jgi:hypothetical protein
VYVLRTAALRHHALRHLDLLPPTWLLHLCLLLHLPLCVCVQSLLGGQPLLIIGVAEPIVISYGFLYAFAKHAPGLGAALFLPFAGWVCIWTALICLLLALSGACAGIGAPAATICVLYNNLASAGKQGFLHVVLQLDGHRQHYITALAIMQQPVTGDLHMHAGCWSCSCQRCCALLLC